MNIQELTVKWQEQHVAIQQHIKINQNLAMEVGKMKVYHLFASMRPIKKFALVVGILWILFVDSLLIATFDFASPYFWVSALLQSLITKVAIGIYTYQLILIYQTDISEAVADTQQRIAKLTLSTLWVTRVLILQLPLWACFWWTETFIQQLTPIAGAFLLAVVILLVAITLWLFLNRKMENSEKRWFRMIFSGREWEPLVKAKEVLGELAEEPNSTGY